MAAMKTRLLGTKDRTTQLMQTLAKTTMIYLSDPYPAYKPSAWLGSVTYRRIGSYLPNRAIFAEVNEQNYPGEQMLSVTITNGVIRQRELLKDTSKKDSSRLDKAAYKLVQPGDIAYNKMRAWQGQSAHRNTKGSSAGLCGSAAVEGNQLTLSALSSENAGFCEGSRALVLRHHLRHVEPAARAFQNDLHVCPTAPRTDLHRPVPRPRRPAHPALHRRQAEADCAAGGTEAGHHQPSRHRPNRRPHRPALPGLQAIRRRVAGG